MRNITLILDFVLKIGLNKFLVHIKLAISGFNLCKKKILILIQTFLKVLILVPTISLHLSTDDVDNGEPRYRSHVVV